MRCLGLGVRELSREPGGEIAHLRASKRHMEKTTYGTKTAQQWCAWGRECRSDNRRTSTLAFAPQIDGTSKWEM